MNLIFKRNKISPFYRHINVGCLLIVLCLILFANPREQLGDVNNDGSVNVVDIVMIVDIILTDGIEYGDYELWASDVNEDETTDISDIVIIVEWILYPPEITECPDDYSPCFDDTTQCCMDTTSHNFTWTIDTLGTNGSYLRDVAIISEDKIWVVGNIVTENGEYNAARWNGMEWELFGIYSNTANLYSIKYFSEDDVWVTSFGFPLHWDGNEWTLYHLQNMGLHVSVGYANWGTSSSNLYFVGYQGAIVHYDGESFEQMSSGTEVELLDIAGYHNDETGTEIVWTGGYDSYGNTDLLVYENGIWQPVYDANSYKDVFRPDSLSGSIDGFWSSDSNLYVSTTWGLYKCPINTNGEGNIMWQGGGAAPKKVRGTSDNNIFFYRSGTEIRHFNGSTWHLYSELVNPIDMMNSLDVKDDIVVLVGYRYYNPIQNWAVIMRGVRN